MIIIIICVITIPFACKDKIFESSCIPFVSICSDAQKKALKQGINKTAPSNMFFTYSEEIP